jgi:hypothetical protein
MNHVDLWHDYLDERLAHSKVPAYTIQCKQRASVSERDFNFRWYGCSDPGPYTTQTARSLYLLLLSDMSRSHGRQCEDNCYGVVAAYCLVEVYRFFSGAFCFYHQGPDKPV